MEYKPPKSGTVASHTLRTVLHCADHMGKPFTFFVDLYARKQSALDLSLLLTDETPFPTRDAEQWSLHRYTRLCLAFPSIIQDHSDRGEIMFLGTFCLVLSSIQNRLLLSHCSQLPRDCSALGMAWPCSPHCHIPQAGFVIHWLFRPCFIFSSSYFWGKHIPHHKHHLCKLFTASIVGNCIT